MLELTKIMAVEIPIVCQGNNILTRIRGVDTPMNLVKVRVEMVELCGKLGGGDICKVSGENCILKPKLHKLILSDGIGDGDEEVID